MSDVAGAMSGLVMAIPAHRMLAARAILHDKKQRIQLKLTALKATPQVNKTALTDRKIAFFEKALVNIEALDASSSRFEFKDLKMLRKGVWLLIGSFALKLISHAL